MGNEQSVSSPPDSSEPTEQNDSNAPASTRQFDDSWWSQIENDELILESFPLLLETSLNTSLEQSAASNIPTNDSEEISPVKEDSAQVTPILKETSSSNEDKINDTNDSSNLIKSIQRAREQSLEEFKEELRVKRLARQTAVQDLRDEITSLRQQLANEQALRRSLQGLDPNEEISLNTSSSSNTNTSTHQISNTLSLNITNQETANNQFHHIVPNSDSTITFSNEKGPKNTNSTNPDGDNDDADDVDPLSRSRHANIELANAQLTLQLSQAENLSLRTELGVVQKQVATLKEVVSCCKQMLTVREEQCDQLKAKLKEIESSMNENEMKIMSSKLRQEYERQLENIRQLRQLYEDRQRVANAEHENLQRLLSIRNDELKAEQEKVKSYEERNQTLVKELENANIELATLREECNEHKFEKKTLKEEMGAINTLFTQMIMGFNGTNNLDIDRLTALLEENRALLSEITTNEENCRYGAALPKLLFELVEQSAVVERNNVRCSLSPTLNVNENETPNDNDGSEENDEDCDGDDGDEGNDDDGDGDANEYEEDEKNAVGNTNIVGITNVVPNNTESNGSFNFDADVDAVAHSNVGTDMVAAEVNDEAVGGNKMDMTDCVNHQDGISNNKELNDEDAATGLSNSKVTSVASSISISHSSKADISNISSEASGPSCSSSSKNINDEILGIEKPKNETDSKEETSIKAFETHGPLSSEATIATVTGTDLSTSTSALESSLKSKSSTLPSALVNNQKSSSKKYCKRGSNVKKTKILAQTGSTLKSSSSGHSDGGTKRTLKFNEPEVMGKVASAQEIIGNLPKVWKVLMELLSHHKIEKVQFEDNDCYKMVETPNGPKPELSVSKTYIKLKDLILEKKSLVKETNRLKALNSHLEYRLNEQEKRLSTVSLELTKTWHLVGKMQRQHRQLHTQEQILRYQLQQKRRLLNELKDELEFCRRRWAVARAKNEESQQLFDEMRRECAQRKIDDANQSGESGYSDSGQQSDDEERRNNVAIKATNVANCLVANANANGTVKVATLDVDVDDDDNDDEVNLELASNSPKVSTLHPSCRLRSHLREMFEHTRKIKRMQSSSPGRNAAAALSAAANARSSNDSNDNDEIVLRWNSAPPTCGWRTIYTSDDEDEDNDEDDDSMNATASASNKGAIPKAVFHNSREKHRSHHQKVKQTNDNGDSTKTMETVNRIELLKEQCKSLIQKVLETSDNRERLEVQLCRFQDEISPVQYAVPLDEFIINKRLERMTRASSAPASGCLTPREEEYTRKRSERLGRLEEESRQLISRIKRTSDRGHYLRCSLDRIRRAPAREESFESNTEEELGKNEDQNDSNPNDKVSLPTSSSNDIDTKNDNKSLLTADEEEYTARRRARLERLEVEGQQLVAHLARSVQRGENLENQLDNIHERFVETQPSGSRDSPQREPLSVEQRLEDINQITNIREERLKILEEQGKELLNRLTNTSEKGTQMINRIAERERRKEQKDLEACTTNEKLNDIESPSGSIKGEGSLNESKGNIDNSPSPKEAVLATAESPTGDVTLDSVEGAAGTSILLPTPNNIASFSIVGEELSNSVMVATTSTQIAAQQGAIPKSKPQAELSVYARAKQARVATEPSETLSNEKEEQEESLEDMIKRLKDLPFPANSEVPSPTNPDSNEMENQRVSNDPEKEEKSIPQPENNC